MITLKEQLERAAARLESRGITYAIAGGIAASIYGEVRVTKDVDFIIGGPENLEHAGHLLLEELGLRTTIARKADLEGGPLFAIRKKSTPAMVLIGRDPENNSPGVDLLLPANIWVGRALERAASNQLDFGSRHFPTLTVEDVIVAKLISSKAPNREQDILDLRSIFRAKHPDLQLTYIADRMREYTATLLPSLEAEAPPELVRVSQRLSRELRRERR